MQPQSDLRSVEMVGFRPEKFGAEKARGARNERATHARSATAALDSLSPLHKPGSTRRSQTKSSSPINPTSLHRRPHHILQPSKPCPKPIASGRTPIDLATKTRLRSIRLQIGPASSLTAPHSSRGTYLNPQAFLTYYGIKFVAR